MKRTKLGLQKRRVFRGGNGEAKILAASVNKAPDMPGPATMGGTGLERKPELPGNTHAAAESGAQSGALSTIVGPAELTDRTSASGALTAALDAWQALSETDRRRFLAVVWQELSEADQRSLLASVNARRDG